LFAAEPGYCRRERGIFISFLMELVHERVLLMSLNERNIFLLDGVGATLSAALIGLILPLFSHWVGLPSWSLHYLAILPLIYAFYSFACYRFVTPVTPSLLKTIVILNLVYCLISGAVIFAFPAITVWGRAILTAEILITLGVVAIEMKIYRKVFCFSQPKRVPDF
jgi:hypothetical protein